MKAKDTIMSEEQRRAEVFKPHEEAELGYCFKCVEMIANAQAEISFNLRTKDILRQLSEFNQRGLSLAEAIALLK